MSNEKKNIEMWLAVTECCKVKIERSNEGLNNYDHSVLSSRAKTKGQTW